MKSLVTGPLFGPVNYRGIVGDMPSGNVYSVRPGIPIIANAADIMVLLDRGFTVVPPSIYLLGAKTLSSDQILHANNSPIEIIEAPPNDCIIVVTNSLYNFTFGTVAYTGGGTFGLVYGDMATAADSGDNTIPLSTNNAATAATSGLSQGNVDTNSIIGTNVVYGPTSAVQYNDGDGLLTIMAFGFIALAKMN